MGVGDNRIGTLRGNPDVAGAARTLARSIRKGDPALLAELLTSGTLGSRSLTLALDFII